MFFGDYFVALTLVSSLSFSSVIDAWLYLHVYVIIKKTQNILAKSFSSFAIFWTLFLMDNIKKHHKIKEGTNMTEVFELRRCLAKSNTV